MNWSTLIAISVVLYSASVLLQRVILRENENQPIAFSIIFQVVAGLVALVTGLVFSDFSLPKNLTDIAFYIILMGVFYGFFNVFAFKSLKLIEASKFSIIISTKAFFTVLASSLLLKETLGTLQFFGALLIFTGVVLVNIKSSKFKLNKGEMYALSAAALFGFANTNDRFLLGSFNVYTYLTLSFFIAPLIISLIYPKEIKQVRVFLKKGVFGKVILLSAMYSYAALTFFRALQVGENSSQVASAGLTTVIVTVLLSAIFLKERDNLAKKIVASILSFIGLLLLT